MVPAQQHNGNVSVLTMGLLTIIDVVMIFRCSEGSGYVADRIDGSSISHCVMYSPYITAGYMPLEPDTISAQLLVCRIIFSCCEISRARSDQRLLFVY